MFVERYLLLTVGRWTCPCPGGLLSYSARDGGREMLQAPNCCSGGDLFSVKRDNVVVKVDQWESRKPAADAERLVERSDVCVLGFDIARNNPAS